MPQAEKHMATEASKYPKCGARQCGSGGPIRTKQSHYPANFLPRYRPKAEKNAQEENKTELGGRGAHEIPHIRSVLFYVLEKAQRPHGKRNTAKANKTCRTQVAISPSLFYPSRRGKESRKTSNNRRMAIADINVDRQGGTSDG